MLGLNSMAGSLGRMLGPALVVLITPLAGPQVVFLAAAVLVCMVALASGLVLRLPGGNDGAHHLAEQAKP
jgi:hypothetical protein